MGRAPGIWGLFAHGIALSHLGGVDGSVLLSSDPARSTLRGVGADRAPVGIVRGKGVSPC